MPVFLRNLGIGARLKKMSMNKSRFSKNKWKKAIRVFGLDYAKKVQKAYEETAGRKKMLNYYRTIVRSTEFQELIKEWRSYCGIPKGGLAPLKSWNFKSPSQLIIQGLYEEVRKEVRLFVECNFLHLLDWEEPILFYLLFNKEPEFFNTNAQDLVLFSDLVDEKKEPFSSTTQEDDLRMYPLAIKISPYASQRDIISFIKKLYKLEIEPSQIAYRDDSILIGRFKERKEQKRAYYDFIFENRDLRIKKIAEKAYEKYGRAFPYDQGAISKIRSLEVKRRKKV